MDQTLFATIVGQKSQPMYVSAGAASAQAVGSIGPPPPAPPVPVDAPPDAGPDVELVVAAPVPAPPVPALAADPLSLLSEHAVEDTATVAQPTAMSEAS